MAVLLFCLASSYWFDTGYGPSFISQFFTVFFTLISFPFHLDANRVFWTSSTSLRVVKKEGEDYLLPCLLTEPAATDLGLRMDNGTTVPPGMNFTVYRHQGILIHSLHPSFNADYVCTAKVNGVEKTSKTFSINIIQSETNYLLDMRPRSDSLTIRYSFPVSAHSRAPFPSVRLLGDRWICAHCWGATRDSLHHAQSQLQLQRHLEIHHQVGQCEPFCVE